MHGCDPSLPNSTGQARPNPIFLDNYGAQMTNLNLVLSSPAHFTSEHTEAERRTTWPLAAWGQGMPDWDQKHPSPTRAASRDNPKDQLWAEGRRCPLTLLMGCLGGGTKAGGCRRTGRPLPLPLPTQWPGSIPGLPAVNKSEVQKESRKGRSLLGSPLSQGKILTKSV